MKPLTAKQAAVLEIIKKCISAQGYSPSTREIADKIGVTQTAAMNYVKTLSAKGKIRYEPGKPRTITLVDENTFSIT